MAHTTDTPTAAPAPRRGDDLRAAVAAAAAFMAVLAAAAAAFGFALSYHALYDWAAGHGFPPGWEAAIFPVTIDAFIAFGELAAFIAVAQGWATWPGWVLAGVGTAVSLTGNIGHDPAASPWARGSFAVPPLAAAGMLWAGLWLLKCWVAPQPADRGKDPQPVSAPARSGTVRSGHAQRRKAGPAPKLRDGGIEAARQAVADAVAGGRKPPARNVLAREYLAPEGRPTAGRSEAGRILAELNGGPQ